MTDRPKAKRSMQVNLELPADLEAVYANFALITHSASEIIVDFARVLPNTPKARIHARVLMTPMNAKLLYNALGDNLGKFEQQYGEIKVSSNSFDDARPMGFRK
jgi:hypothetical protein